ncbi:metal-sulfur cluster assembly factor [Bacillus sp. DJP31]|uniref:metal-sulfur cluster assembly factor n=1 Tax=Bacillus sp. DJP31 TaxID=3409789 RepID=UPI003BB7E2DE
MDQAMEESMFGALETVIDPELGVDIVNLGLVYGVELTDEGVAVITMTLTSMGCPLAGTITEGIKIALSDLPEVKGVDVRIVWTPPWTKNRMSRYAKIALRIAD